MSEENKFRIAALYKFASLPNFEELREPIREACERFAVRGTLLLAEEGINGTIASSPDGIDGILDYLRTVPGLEDLDHKESFADTQPFYRMKVRLKKEIVTIGVPGTNPNERVGEYVDPEGWNELIAQDDVVVIDTRNDYETALGTFHGAIDPDIKTFREFPEYVHRELDPSKHKRVAMFCTGGIRCEKASAYMLNQGFEEVYHLRGGILKYIEAMPKEKSAWEGDCFVFDERVAVDHDLEPADYALCRGCRNPVSPEDKLSPHYEEGISCPRCYADLTEEKRQSRLERQKQELLAKQRGESHVGRTE